MQNPEALPIVPGNLSRYPRSVGSGRVTQHLMTANDPDPSAGLSSWLGAQPLRAVSSSGGGFRADRERYPDRQALLLNLSAAQLGRKLNGAIQNLQSLVNSSSVNPGCTFF
jgi:hypothetical protein